MSVRTFPFFSRRRRIRHAIGFRLVGAARAGAAFLVARGGAVFFRIHLRSLLMLRSVPMAADAVHHNKDRGPLCP